MMTTIPAETTLIGEIRSKGKMRIEGHVEGTGDIDGMLLLTRQCVWKGKIIADVVIVEGTMEGDIIARQKLEIYSNAKISGSIICPKISIMEGASVNGTLRMKQPEPPIGLLESKARKDKKAQAEEKRTAKAVGE
ncbi:MAG: polymer-forming cytoskeletal protein [Gammaproteobacteria bacterium]|nr:polymer-forming cytoskeletal protein [Gammaproteobacteria bacterium]